MQRELREPIPSNKIEIAKETDIPDVVNIAQELRLDPTNPDQSKISNGFLIYPLSEQGYKERLNPYFYVSQSNETDGFLMCYDRTFLQGLINKGEISHEDGIIDYLSQIPSDNNYIFGDQIGVKISSQSTGVGKEMMGRLFDDMSSGSIIDMYVAILHQPVPNHASYRFCTSLGAKNVAEVTNRDSLVWGIYQFRI